MRSIQSLKEFNTSLRRFLLHQETRSIGCARREARARDCASLGALPLKNPSNIQDINAFMIPFALAGYANRAE